MAVLVRGMNFFGYFLIGVPQIVLMVAMLGVLLGAASSAIAIRRHLKI